MATKEYSETEKATAVERAKKIGVKSAAAELGIPWQALAKWNKGSEKSNAQKKSVENEEKTVTKTRGRKPGKVRKTVLKTSGKKSQRTKTAISSSKKSIKEIDKSSVTDKQIVKLLAENMALKAEVARLKKIVTKLI